MSDNVIDARELFHPRLHRPPESKAAIVRREAVQRAMRIVLHQGAPANDRDPDAA